MQATFNILFITGKIVRNGKHEGFLPHVQNIQPMPKSLHTENKQAHALNEGN